MQNPNPNPRQNQKQSPNKQKTLTLQTWMWKKKHPMLKLLHRQVKKRRAKAKTNAQTLKQGHYIDSKQNLCLGKNHGIFCVSDGFVVHLIL